MSPTIRAIRAHQHKVEQNLLKICSLLIKRGQEHDNSKLKEPELSGWEAMDKEPRYPYGTEEYFDKQERYKWLFEEHYKNNRHHPEHYKGYLCEMDLIDVIEMICDWASFDEMTDEDAISILEQQMDRFGFDEILKNLILNTYKNYLCITDEEKEKLEYQRKWGELLDKKNIDINLLNENFN